MTTNQTNTNNRAVILILYFALGIVLEFPMLALRLWLKDELHLNIPAIGVLMGTVSMPWVFKPIYGIVSDQFPLCGRRRKPYIVLCNLAAGTLWLVIGSVEQTTHTVMLFGVLTQLVTCFADVMYDASMVELSNAEQTAEAGNYQSKCWAVRAAGSVIAAITGGVASEYFTKPQVFCIQAGFPFAMALLTLVFFHEGKGACSSGPRCAGVTRVIAALSDPRLWKPALFVCVFAATPSSGNAWFYFLSSSRGFSDKSMGMLSCLRHGAMFIGTLIYRRWFRQYAFRPFFVAMVTLSAVLSLSPLILIHELNRSIGLPDFLFVAGDDVFLATVGQIAMMPCLILAAKLCPEGIEASLYASFIALMNGAALLSDYIGSWLTYAVGVTHEDFDRLGVLVWLCAASSLVPLVFVRLLPDGSIADVVSIEDGDSSDVELTVYEPQCTPDEHNVASDDDEQVGDGNLDRAEECLLATTET